jgi:hypothetical protein
MKVKDVSNIKLIASTLSTLSEAYTEVNSKSAVS